MTKEITPKEFLKRYMPTETPFQRHMKQQKKFKPAVPCSSGHAAIGGGCFNCLWDGK